MTMMTGRMTTTEVVIGLLSIYHGNGERAYLSPVKDGDIFGFIPHPR